MNQDSGEKRFSFHLFLFLLFALLQYLLFRTYVLREIAPGYPTNHDQTNLLVHSYQLFESLLKEGFLKSLRQYLFEARIPQGFLLPLEAAFLYLFLGASRLTALTVNFIHFFAYQVIFWLVLKKWTGSWTLAWIGWGLLLSLKSTFFFAGGIDDFRLDFATFCLFGIYLTVVLHSRIFYSRFWSILAGIIGSLLILTRSFSAIYLFGFLTLLTLGLWIQRIFKTNLGDPFCIRLRNILLSGFICLFVGGPVLWINRQSIYDYYVVGHILGKEKEIRAKEMGDLNWKKHLEYYPRSLTRHHIGESTVYLFFIIVFFGGLGQIFSKKVSEHSQTNEMGQKSQPYLEEFLCIGFSFLVPFLILTIHQLKSPVTGSILVPSFLWFTMLLLVLLWRTTTSTKKQWTMLLSLGVVMIMAFNNQVRGYCRKGPFGYRNSDARQIGRMYQEISETCLKSRNFTPNFSVNHLADYLGYNIFMTEAYERAGVNLKVRGLLGNSIFSFSKEEAWKHLNESDIVILSDRFSGNLPPYPFYESMSEWKETIEKKVTFEFDLLGSYVLSTHRLQAFIRPTYQITGLTADGWITDSGITLVIPKKTAVKSSAVEFSAGVPGALYSGVQVEASYITGNGKRAKLNAHLQIKENTGIVQVKLPGREFHSHAEDEMAIHLLFSDYFVPRELGINPDQRKLVLFNPHNKKVILKKPTLF